MIDTKDLWWLLRAARPEVVRLLGAAVLGSAALGCAIGLVATAAWLVSRAAEQPPVLALAIACVRVFGVGRGVLRYCERLVSHDAAFRVMARTRVAVYEDLERAAPAGLGRLRGGDLLARVVSDVDAVQDLLVRSLLPVAVALITGGASVLLIGVLLPAAGVVVLIGLLVAGLVAPAAVLAAAGRADRSLAPARGALSETVVELLNGVADLTAHRATGRWLDRLDRQDRELTALAQRAATGTGIAAAVSTAALGLTMLGELLVGIPAVQSGRISGVVLAVLVLTPLAAFELTAPLPLAAQHLSRGMRAVGRLRALADLPRPATPGGHLPVPFGSLSLEVRGLTARWPGAAAPALHDLDLTLTPGRRIAVVGESGAGKSTLVTALLGFLAPESGQIRLVGSGGFGVDLADLEDGARRQAIAACTQDAHLFDSTIRHNLLLARPDATESELAEALQKARMWRWVGRLPSRLDTPVGERGVRLSGGERQRLALARALLADPAVLLLDEPTAHVDEATADALMRDLLVATQGRTTLLVTHRLAGLGVVDEIIVLAGGRVIQRGAPTELIHTDGPYRRMWLRSAAKDNVRADAPTMQISSALLTRHSPLATPEL
ncbi:thiol reductant ABC exporter subunit CydC [Actinopolymorpha alba]|uniref:thiol reductant ABC exporter subunit CydC n=1 Tax=Actinopolymorpha alba TaxID=533267 RepID=UPI0003A52B5F|nr:thiol reductant ABC exporter subunit CydC [Actinopolymorpha alba]